MDSKLKIVLGNIYAFFVYGIFYGAVVGALNGVLAGAALGFLLGLTGHPSLNFLSTATPPTWRPTFETVLASSMGGGIFGGMCMTVVGIVASVPAWIIAGVTHWKRDEDDIIRDALRGIVRASILMTSAGASSGVLFHSLWLYTTQNAKNALQMSLEPLEGGFFWGSIIGCAFGLFFGAIFGARPVRSWLNVPMREMPSEVRDGVLRLIQTR